MKKAESVEEYIQTAPIELQQSLYDLRGAILAVCPSARETVSYMMPYYFYKGRLMYFAWTKKHIGIYAISQSVRSQFSKELKDFDMSKGTIRFPLDKKLPIGLIKKLVKAQMRFNEEKIGK